jgi:hypothetical protein
MQPCRSVAVALLTVLFVACSSSSTPATCSVTPTAVTVQALNRLNATGLPLASVGETFGITATGTVNLADANGGYVTSPNGDIVTAPTAGSVANTFFTGEIPTGVAPAVGAQKSPSSQYQGEATLGTAPYGALLAGFSTNANPTLASDFPNGFTVVGASATVTAAAAAYLFLSVNDFNYVDNSGSYSASVCPSK